MFAFVFASLCRTFDDNPFPAGLAFTRFGSVSCAVKLTARRAHICVFGVASVFRKKITREKIIRLAAASAGMLLNPEEILNVGIPRPALKTGRFVIGPDLLLQTFDEIIRSFTISLQVQMFDLLPHNPVRHGVDVITDYVATKPVRFKKRRTAAHERIEDSEAGEIIGRIECVPKRFAYEFGKNQPAKQRPRPPREPLVDRDDRPVVLLYLLLAQSQG